MDVDIRDMIGILDAVSAAAFVPERYQLRCGVTNSNDLYLELTGSDHDGRPKLLVLCGVGVDKPLAKMREYVANSIEDWQPHVVEQAVLDTDWSSCADLRVMAKTAARIPNGLNIH